MVKNFTDRRTLEKSGYQIVGKHPTAGGLPPSTRALQINFADTAFRAKDGEWFYVLTKPRVPRQRPRP